MRQIVTEIKTTRVVIAHKVNSAMMQMYRNIGKRLSAEKLRQLVALLPWKHNLLIMSKAKSLVEAKYYVELTHENSLSRNMFAHACKMIKVAKTARRKIDAVNT
jgi:hypothetical protein